MLIKSRLRILKAKLYSVKIENPSDSPNKEITGRVQIVQNKVKPPAMRPKPDKEERATACAIALCLIKLIKPTTKMPLSKLISAAKKIFTQFNAAPRTHMSS